MYKILITSDIHLGPTKPKMVRRMVKQMKQLNPDMLIIAGDVGESTKLFSQCLELFSELEVPTHVILGNHDLWNKDVPAKELINQVYPVVCVRNRCGLFDGDFVLSNDCKTLIVGSMAWYDYKACSDYGETDNSEIASRKKNYNVDGSRITGDWDDLEFAAECRRKIFRSLQYAEDHEQIERSVLVTHIPVHPVQRVPAEGDSPLADGYFYHYSIGEELDKYKKLSDVISGHTHRQMDEALALSPDHEVRFQVIPSDYYKPKFVEINV